MTETGAVKRRFRIMMPVLSVLFLLFTGCAQKPAPELPVQELLPGEEACEADPGDCRAGEAAVRIWEDAGITVSVAMPVTNQSDHDLYLKYTQADLIENGAVIDTLEFVECIPQVLRPGETGWYYTVDYPEHVKKEMMLTAELKPQAEVSRIACVRLELSDIEYADNPNIGIDAAGTAVNTSDTAVNDANVYVHFYDADGHLMAQARSEGISLEPGEQTKWTAQAWYADPFAKAENVAGYEAVAYPYDWNE